MQNITIAHNVFENTCTKVMQSMQHMCSEHRKAGSIILILLVLITYIWIYLVFGNHTITVIKGREDHATLKESLSNVIRDVNNLTDDGYMIILPGRRLQGDCSNFVQIICCLLQDSQK